MRVPIHRHRPAGVGVRVTGWTRAASSCDVTAIIGCENVTDSAGAIGTAPSGLHRTTSRSLVASGGVGGRSVDGAGGNVVVIVVPVRGAGWDRGRIANACGSAGSATSGRVRASSDVTSAAASGVAGASRARSNAGTPALPLDTRRSRPSGISVDATVGAVGTPGSLVERLLPQPSTNTHDAAITAHTSDFVFTWPPAPSLAQR